MIKLSDIRKAIAVLLEKTGVTYITGEDLQQERNYDRAIDDAGEDKRIIQIMIEPQSFHTLDAGRLSEKSILVDIAYLCGMDTSRRDIQDMLDTMDSIIRPCVQVQDRYFTIQSANSNITDNVGHYVFNINFIDGELAEVPEPLMDGILFDI